MSYKDGDGRFGSKVKGVAATLVVIGVIAGGVWYNSTLKPATPSSSPAPTEDVAPAPSPTPSPSASATPAAKDAKKPGAEKAKK